MTSTSFLLLSLALAAAAADWVAVHQGAKVLEYVCKPLTLVLLVATALAIDPIDPVVRTWFVIGLVLSLAGDVLLMLPSRLFVAGLAAFLLGHVAYIVGMHVDGVAGSRFLVGVVVVMVALTLVGTTVLKGVRAGPEPRLAGPVVAYMFVISAMVASAVGTGHLAGVVGAGLFYASDTLLAWNRFLRETRHGRVAVMVTYHLAQVGLVLSLV